MKKISIIHYYPIEYFPPIVNLLNFISTNLSNQKITVFTCYNTKNRKPFQNNSIQIYRFDSPQTTDNFFTRSFKYIHFNFSCLFRLVIEKPDAILYYESISAWPAYIYKRHFNRNCNVLIHYHEYASQEWYNKYMFLVKYFHSLEKQFLYINAIWISQTNALRISLFKKDNHFINPSFLKVLPNYPPKVWANKNRLPKTEASKKIVYIGSLAFESTYIQEFCGWILNQSFYTLDIYSYNLHKDVKEYLLGIQGEKISYHETGVEYDNIPEVLQNYNVGVILHRAFNDNYKFNATNKLFEYLACDLDVWFPLEMQGCYEYITSGTYPQVKRIDFASLPSIKPEDMKRRNLIYKALHFWCEDAFQPLTKELLVD